MGQTGRELVLGGPGPGLVRLDPRTGQDQLTEAGRLPGSGMELADRPGS